MRHHTRVAVLLFLAIQGAACAPRQLKPVAAIDPAPLLEHVAVRQEALEEGVSGSLELSFSGKQRFNRKVFVVAFPDGRFRLEVPGPFGDTHLVMTSDNREILAFYPGENRAFRSAVNGKSLNPHLPFPLPVETGWLAALIMGVLPDETSLYQYRAYLMDSGEKQLQAATGDNGLQFTWLFDGDGKGNIRSVSANGKNMNFATRTRNNAGHLPRDFSLTTAEGVLKGEWDKVALFEGDKSVLKVPLPDSVIITDLEAAN